METQIETLSLYELNKRVRCSLEKALPDKYWVQAELSEVRINNSGHCYVELVQKASQGNDLLAKARGTIWKNRFGMLKHNFEKSTGQPFVAGIKVLVLVSVNFHELYGLSLYIEEIDPTYTLGDLARRRQEILKQLEKEGILTLNKELEMPALPRRIAVISSSTAAGYGDFCDQLQRNSRGFYFCVTLFPALMQGERLEKSILAALDAIHTRREDFDVVVIIRGGGSTSELSDFDTYLLAAACAQFPLPILTGIGHERDETVIDRVAHTRVKTPTAAAEFLIGCMEEAANRLESLAHQLQTLASSFLKEEHRRLEMLTLRLQTHASSFLKEEHHRLESSKQNLSAVAFKRLSSARLLLNGYDKDLWATSRACLKQRQHQLELLGQRLTDLSPEKQFARGYSLTLSAGKVVKDASLLKEGDQLVTRLYHGEVSSVITSTTTHS